MPWEYLNIRLVAKYQVLVNHCINNFPMLCKAVVFLQKDTLRKHLIMALETQNASLIKKKIKMKLGSSTRVVLLCIVTNFK